MAQPILLWGCPTLAEKRPKNTQKTFFACYWAFVRQLPAIKVDPHQFPSHQSILLIQGPIHEIFTKNIENWRFWKTTFFWVGHFGFFASFPWKSVTNYVLEWIGLNFFIMMVYSQKWAQEWWKNMSVPIWQNYGNFDEKLIVLGKLVK